MRVFILEDDWTRMALFNEALAGSVVAHAESVKDALEILAKAKADGEDFDLFLLDHDLGGKQMVNTQDENTGSAFVRSELAQKMMTGKPVIVHSYNPDGAAYMLSKIPHAERVPFGLTLLDALKQRKR